MISRSLRLALAAVLVLCAPWAPALQAQVALDSPHLQNPELILDYVETNADFWLGDAYDEARGGFYTNIARDGSVNTGWGTNKDVLTQSRNAYAMARAFQLTGDERYLDYARGALDFLYEHGWDPVHGGWFNRLSESGQALDPNAQKTAFIQHYALLGPMAMVEATGSAGDAAWLGAGYAWMEEHLWDSDAARFGYYDRVSRSGASPTGKSFNATVDAFTTHALQLYTGSGDDAYGTRLDALAANVLDRLVASMPDQAIGFAEKYSSAWQPLGSERLTIMGHVLKSAWVLGRLHAVRPNPAYLGAAETLAQHVLDRGYDHDLGGPYKDFDRTTGEMILWGLPDTTKAWWQMEQAVTAGLELYRHTDDPAYLSMADGTMRFFMEHFQDAFHGEVFADVTRYGETIPQWGNLFKGDGYKAAYHSIELGYYAYLYSQLFVHGQPARLHYRFAPAAEDRTLRLSPLAAAEGEVLLTSVTLDGVPYADFDAATRVLRLPSGTGGLVAATFAPGATTDTDDAAAPSDALALESLFPNPSTDAATLTYTLPTSAPVRAVVYDVLGREVVRQAASSSGPGRHTLRLDVSGLPSGVYVVRLEAGASSAAQRFTVAR